VDPRLRGDDALERGGAKKILSLYLSLYLCLFPQILISLPIVLPAGLKPTPACAGVTKTSFLFQKKTYLAGKSVLKKIRRSGFF